MLKAVYFSLPPFASSVLIARFYSALWRWKQGVSALSVDSANFILFVDCGKSAVLFQILSAYKCTWSSKDVSVSEFLGLFSSVSGVPKNA